MNLLASTVIGGVLYAISLMGLFSTEDNNMLIKARRLKMHRTGGISEHVHRDYKKQQNCSKVEKQN